MRQRNKLQVYEGSDGMALAFYRSPEEPAQCAFEISRALKDNERLQVRMGILFARSLASLACARKTGRVGTVMSLISASNTTRPDQAVQRTAGHSLDQLRVASSLSQQPRAHSPAVADLVLVRRHGVHSLVPAFPRIH